MSYKQVMSYEIYHIINKLNHSKKKSTISNRDIKLLCIFTWKTYVEKKVNNNADKANIRQASWALKAINKLGNIYIFIEIIHTWT